MKNFLIIVFLYFSINRLTNFLKNSSLNLKVVKNIDFLFLIRPTSYFIIWLVLCVGMYIPAFAYDDIQLFVKEFNLNTFVFFVSITFFSVFYLVNDQLINVENNYLLKKKYDIVFLNKLKMISFLISVLLMIIACWPLMFVLILFYMLSDKFFNSINVLNVNYVCYQIFSIILLLYIGIYFKIFQSNLLFSFDIFQFSIPYILLLLSIYLLHNIYSLINKNIFSSNSIVSLTALLINLLALLLLLIFQDPLGSTILSVIIFFNFYAFLRGERKDYLRTVRYGIGILNYFMLIIYPILFIPILILFYVSKYYYWHRFDIHYPTFLVTKNTYCPVDLVLKGKK